MILMALFILSENATSSEIYRSRVRLSDVLESDNRLLWNRLRITNASQWGHCRFMQREVRMTVRRQEGVSRTVSRQDLLAKRCPTLPSPDQHQLALVKCNMNPELRGNESS
ncbi:hypothetical protein AOLI_G00305240 [Acnodon oligacanthus]